MLDGLRVPEFKRRNCWLCSFVLVRKPKVSSVFDCDVSVCGAAGTARITSIRSQRPALPFGLLTGLACLGQNISPSSHAERVPPLASQHSCFSSFSPSLRPVGPSFNIAFPECLGGCPNPSQGFPYRRSRGRFSESFHSPHVAVCLFCSAPDPAPWPLLLWASAIGARNRERPGLH